jgi:ubiquinone biosynthesis protein UbiJ
VVAAAPEAAASARQAAAAAAVIGFIVLAPSAEARALRLTVYWISLHTLGEGAAADKPSQRAGEGARLGWRLSSGGIPVKLQISAAAAALVVVAAGGAQAADMGCLWAHVPAAKKAALYGAGEATVGDRLAALVASADADAAARACGLDPAAMKRADGEALVAVMSRDWAERRLAAAAQIPAKRLDAAWTALLPELKAKVRSGDVAALREAVKATRVRLGAPEAPALPLTLYLDARARQAS